MKYLEGLLFGLVVGLIVGTFFMAIMAGLK